MRETVALAREREREVTAVCAQDEAAVPAVSGMWDVTCMAALYVGIHWCG